MLGTTRSRSENPHAISSRVYAPRSGGCHSSVSICMIRLSVLSEAHHTLVSFKEQSLLASRRNPKSSSPILPASKRPGPRRGRLGTDEAGALAKLHRQGPADDRSCRGQLPRDCEETMNSISFSLILSRPAQRRAQLLSGRHNAVGHFEFQLTTSCRSHETGVSTHIMAGLPATWSAW